MNKLLCIALILGSSCAERLSNGYGAPPAPSRTSNGRNGNGRNGNSLSNGYNAPSASSSPSNGFAAPVGNGLSNNYAAPSSGGNGFAAATSNNYAAPSNNVFNTNGFSNGNGGFNGGNNGGSNGGFSNGNGNGYSNGGASEQDLLAANIPGGGVPGEDFPLLSEVPETGFSCEEQAVGGYYADDAPEAGCQAYHICQLRESGLVQQDSFLCPNGTIFNQQYLVCDWWFNFDCSTAQDFYSVNEAIGVIPESSASTNGDASYGAASTNNVNGNGGGNGYSNGAASRPSSNGGSGYSNGNGRNGNGNRFSNGGGSRGGYGY